MPDSPIITLTLCRYQGVVNQWSAFRAIGLTRLTNSPMEGLQFLKLLGSGGGNGFSIFPNFGVYGLLGVWDNLASAKKGLSTHKVYHRFRGNAIEHWTVFLQTVKSHGKWSGTNPFVEQSIDVPEGLVGVITRATIHTRHLLDFWRHVPGASRAIAGQPGLIFSVGIGEWPLVQQATFSLWEDIKSVEQFAYKDKAHSEVVKRTRQRGWYREELFARFLPIATHGHWNGQNPLANYRINDLDLKI